MHRLWHRRRKRKWQRQGRDWHLSDNLPCNMGHFPAPPQAFMHLRRPEQERSGASCRLGARVIEASLGVG
jgi:hypothetical protein